MLGVVPAIKTFSVVQGIIISGSLAVCSGAAVGDAHPPPFPPAISGRELTIQGDGISIVSGRVLQDGTCECQCPTNVSIGTPSDETPETIRLYVRGEGYYDGRIAQRFSERAQAYFEMTGIKVEVVRGPPNRDWGTELASLAGTAVYDGFCFFPAITASLVEVNALADISQYVGEEIFGWNDELPFVRENLAVFDNKVRLLPTEAEPMFLYYRKDLFDLHNIRVPRTWDEYSEVAKYFHGMEVSAPDGNGTVTMVGSCIDRGFQDWLRNLLIFAVHTSTVVSKGTNQGIMFDSFDMIPGLGEAIAETMRHVENQARYGAGDELDFKRHGYTSVNERYFLQQGNCAMTYFWGEIFINQFSASSKVAGKVGVARTPGVTKVYDHRSGKLVKCNAATCPHGIDYRDIGRVNYAALVTGGVVGTVATNLPQYREEAMAKFIGFVAGQQESIKDVITTPGQSGALRSKPFRTSHLNITAWVEKGYPRDTTQQYLQAIEDTLSSKTAAIDERTPGAYHLKELLGQLSVPFLVRSKTEEITHADRMAFAADIEKVWMDWIADYNANRPANSSTFNTLYQKDASVFIPPKEEKSLSTESMVGLIVGCSLAVILVLGAVFWFIEQKRRSDLSMWVVKPTELHFDTPPVVVGRGSYGCVLLADYRGTQVAVKRVLPPKSAVASDRGSSSLSTQTPLVLPMLPTSTGYVDSMHVSSPASMVCSGRLRILQKNEVKEVAEYRKRKKAFRNEIRYLSKLRHPCITTVMGAVISPDVEPMLVMEYMQNGSLSDILHNETIILENETKLAIIRDASQGIRFLHAATPKVIHGDLKAANILIDGRLRAKVADFGLSEEGGHSGRACGTPFWMAPELLRKECSNNSSTDVYSFGIILYEVYSEDFPYKGEDPVTVLRLVASKTVNKRPQMPDDCPSPIRNLMMDCVDGDPEKRPDFDEIDRRLKRIKVEDPVIHIGGQELVVSGLEKFPEHVAEALKAGRDVEPERHDMVSIFVCSLVISVEMHQDKMEDLFSRLYGKLDSLRAQHGVFRVDTVGRSYMGVTNLVSDHPLDHTRMIVRFAMDAIVAASHTLIDPDDSSLGFASIRCGIHCGPVVTDVVGTSPPRYCLVGETVNTASLLEVTSEPGRIHCSDIAVQMVRIQMPELPVIDRGVVAIESKGEMMTFWLNEKMASTKPQQPSHGSGSTGTVVSSSLNTTDSPVLVKTA